MRNEKKAELYKGTRKRQKRRFRTWEDEKGIKLWKEIMIRPNN